MEYIVPAIITLLFSSFFSGIEIAFFSSNRLSIELARKEGNRSGRILSFFQKNISNFIGTTLMGNNIALVIFGILMAKMLEPVLGQYTPNEFVILLVQTVIATIVVLLFGEFIPKTLFRISPIATLSFFAPLLHFIYYLLYPFVTVVVYLAKFILKTVFREEYQESESAFTRLDLRYLIQQSTPDEDEDSEIDTILFENALTLNQIKVRECMIPRTEITAMDINAPIGDLRQKFIDEGYSRIPIYYESLDNILGYVHHFDLLTKPQSVGSVMMKIPVVPEAMLARDLLNSLRKGRKTMAWVVDEHGGTAGIVTIEDLLEELFGEIHDEHDEEEFVEQQVAENEFILSGRLEIDYLNEKYNLNLPQGEYEALAGFIVSTHESIPEMEEVIHVDHCEFTILLANNTRIETVRLRLLDKKD